MTTLKPKWWQLYALLPLTIGLFVVEARSALSPSGHREVEIGLVILFFLLGRFWLQSNRRALIQESLREAASAREPLSLTVEPLGDETAVGAPAPESDSPGEPETALAGCLTLTSPVSVR